PGLAAAPRHVALLARHAELGTELAREALGRDHDPGLDDHLVDRLVEHRHQALDLGHALRDVDHQQGVGAAVEADAAAAGQEATAVLGAHLARTTRADAGLAFL